MIDYKRVDPPDCACVDCGSGLSKPFQAVDDEMLRALLHGHVTDATGGDFGGDVPDWINRLGQAAFADLLVEEWVAGRVMSNPSLAGVVKTWRATKSGVLLDERVDGLLYPNGVTDGQSGNTRDHWETRCGSLTEVQ